MTPDQQTRDRLAEYEATLRALDEELETLRHAVSHDLRAPLRGIQGFTRSVLDDHSERLGPEAREDLERVLAAAARLGGLIDDLVRLLSAARRSDVEEAVDLSALAGEVARELRQADPGRDVHLEITPGLAARGDPRALRLVLEHLLRNAWKFTRARPGARILFGSALSHGERAYFVRDEGVGFDPTYAHKLFAAFQRLHPTAEYEGSGIGLATVKRIVLRHGGRVWAESGPQGGATFWFTLGGRP